MKVVMSGASGFIGQELLKHFEDPVLLTRSLSHVPTHLRHLTWKTWDSQSEWVDSAILENADVVIHLSGENIATDRWTPKKKMSIRNSRVESTQRWVESLASLKSPPKLFICASAIGFYGDTAEEWATEDSPMGQGFLAEVCRDWELSALEAQKIGIRTACLRSGVVLSCQGGMLKKILPFFRKNLGSVLGTGHQWMSWIHLSDWIGVVKQITTDDKLQGPINLVTPHPVTQREFSESLAHVLGKKLFLPAVPEPLLRWALGERAGLILNSQKVAPQKVQTNQFTFKFPILEQALKQET